MEVHFFLGCGQFLTFLEKTIHWHFLDLHHVDVVTHRNHHLITQSDVLIRIYYSAWSQFSVFTYVGCTRTDTRTTTLVLVLLHLPTHHNSLGILLAIGHIGNIVILSKYILFDFLESASHVVRITLGPVVVKGASIAE